MSRLESLLSPWNFRIHGDRSAQTTHWALGVGLALLAFPSPFELFTFATGLDNPICIQLPFLDIGRSQWRNPLWGKKNARAANNTAPTHTHTVLTRTRGVERGLSKIAMGLWGTPLLNSLTPSHFNPQCK